MEISQLLHHNFHFYTTGRHVHSLSLLASSSLFSIGRLLLSLPLFPRPGKSANVVRTGRSGYAFKFRRIYDHEIALTTDLEIKLATCVAVKGFASVHECLNSTWANYCSRNGCTHLTRVSFSFSCRIFIVFIVKTQEKNRYICWSYWADKSTFVIK